MKHYFHDFKADGVEEPFRMYTGSWRTPTTMKYFGLSESVIKSDVGYVLVKLVKPRLTMKEQGTFVNFYYVILYLLSVARFNSLILFLFFTFHLLNINFKL
jgi:hypothetical protein